MKKKSGIFMILILCIVCIACMLTGCSSKKITYVDQSFNVESVNSLDTLDKISASYSFDIKSSLTGECKIEYVIAVKDASTGEVAFTKKFEDKRSIKSGDTKTLSYYEGFNRYDYESIQTLMDNAVIELQSITITTITSSGINEEFDSYALGFGLISALLLAGIITAFVLIKLRR